MTPRAAKDPSGAFSRAITEAVLHFSGMSGKSSSALIKDAEMSRNYFYTRMRNEAPFDTNDIEKLAKALGVTPEDLVNEALRVYRPHTARVTPFPSTVDEPTPEALQRAAASQQTPGQDTGEETDQ